MERKEKGGFISDNKRPVLFDLLLDANNGEDFPRLDMEQLIDEALIFTLAGGETTAFALECATFYILHMPGVLAKVREELGRVSTDEKGKYKWKHVQNLPYLVSVQS